MKRFLVAFAAILAVSSVAFAQIPTLPDYEKEAKLIGTAKCDNGETTVTAYRKSEDYFDYFIEVTQTKSGNMFYLMGTGTGPHYFMKAAGQPQAEEMDAQSWSKAIQAEGNSPNFLAWSLLQTSDCKVL